MTPLPWESGFSLLYGVGPRQGKPAAQRVREQRRETRYRCMGPPLCPVDKAGRIAIRPVTAQAMMIRLKRRSEEAGLASCSPRDLRRTFVNDLLEASADIAIMQRLSGHASPPATAR